MENILLKTDKDISVSELLMTIKALVGTNIQVTVKEIVKSVDQDLLEEKQKYILKQYQHQKERRRVRKRYKRK